MHNKKKKKKKRKKKANNINNLIFTVYQGKIWRVFSIIQLPLDHLDPTLVDHLSPYLNTCLIRHPFWLSMSCGSQGNTVQRSFPHKCCQKSRCSAFNAVVAAFPQLFLDSPLSCMFMMHVLITGVSWKVTLIVGIHI